MTLSKSLRQLCEEAFDGPRCSHCGYSKAKGRPFCYGCYKLLPLDMQTDLSRTYSDDLAGAWDDARTWLAANTDARKKPV